MKTINIHEAKTHLSKLVELAARGESFVIAKAGKPMVKVIALDAPEPAHMKRFGFLAGQIKIPKAMRLAGITHGRKKEIDWSRLRNALSIRCQNDTLCYVRTTT